MPRQRSRCATAGSFSAKHGDGRLRGKYLAAVLGEECITAAREVKRAFDPQGLLNPGKILDCAPVSAGLALRSLN
ncbi:MAG: FAD-binding oxidoreductase [Chromatiales bacterium]